MKIIKFFALFIVLAQTSVAANLAELQKAAIENRQVVEKFKANLEKSQEEETIAKSSYFPSADITYTMNSLDDTTAFENEENSVAYGALTWNLFNGFKDKYDIASAKFQRQAEGLRLSGIKQDIQLAVALKYIEIFSRKANLQLEQDNYNTLLKAHKDSQSRFDVGLIDKNELLKFKVDLDNAKISLKRAEADLAKSMQQLQREINTDVSLEELSFAEFEELPNISSYDDLKKTMMENRTELRVLEELAEAAQMQVKASYADYYPKLDATTSYRKYADDFRSSDGTSTNEELRSQLVMSVNIFDGFNKGSGVRRAKLEKQIIKHDIEELKLDLDTDLKNLLLDYEVSIENTDVSLSSIEQAEENLRITDLKYKEGLETETNLLDAIANLTRAKFNHIIAKFDVYNNYYRITRAVEGFEAL